ncbi:hydrogenase maturation protease [Kosmotoga pacifica]|uniref:Hydrogenase maturation protease n=2 Tax=Kosmotoga pacifica TaxID=1330330 RepID=A0A0G2ZDD7_9BACT|nr:hydrogenase maturation protease [Kosmotoga pacifica]AKI97579.1 hypothetical protein IX53_06835 [Kosmotoga pacifica]
MLSNRISTFISTLMDKKVLFVGLGNPLRNDDNVGIFFLELLEELDLPSCWELIKCYRNPENYLCELLSSKSNIIVFIDSIQGTDQDISILSEEEIKDFSFSTHTFGISTIIKYLKSSKDVNFFLIGIKPEKLEVGSGLTQATRRRAIFLFREFERACKKAIG